MVQAVMVRQMQLSDECYFVRIGPAVQPVVRLDPIGTDKVRVTARDGHIVGRSYLLAEMDDAPELKGASHLVEKPAGLPDCRMRFLCRAFNRC